MMKKRIYAEDAAQEDYLLFVVIKLIGDQVDCAERTPDGWEMTPDWSSLSTMTRLKLNQLGCTWDEIAGKLRLKRLWPNS